MRLHIFDEVNGELVLSPMGEDIFCNTLSAMLVIAVMVAFAVIFG